MASLEQKMPLLLLSLRKRQAVQALCARNRGQRPIHTFSIISEGTIHPTPLSK